MKYVYIVLASLFCIFGTSSLALSNRLNNKNNEFIEKEYHLKNIYNLKKRWETQNKSDIEFFLQNNHFEENGLKKNQNGTLLKINLFGLDKNQLNLVAREVFSKNYKIKKFQIKRIDKERADFEFEVEF